MCISNCIWYMLFASRSLFIHFRLLCFQVDPMTYYSMLYLVMRILNNKNHLADNSSRGNASPSPAFDMPVKQSKKSKIISTFNNLRRGSLTSFRKETNSPDRTSLKKSKSVPVDLMVEGEGGEEDEGEEEPETGLPKFHKDRNIMTYMSKGMF